MANPVGSASLLLRPRDGVLDAQLTAARADVHAAREAERDALIAQLLHDNSALTAAVAELELELDGRAARPGAEASAGKRSPLVPPALAAMRDASNGNDGDDDDDDDETGAGARPAASTQSPRLSGYTAWQIRARERTVNLRGASALLRTPTSSAPPSAWATAASTGGSSASSLAARDSAVAAEAGELLFLVDGDVDGDVDASLQATAARCASRTLHAAHDSAQWALEELRLLAGMPPTRRRVAHACASSDQDDEAAGEEGAELGGGGGGGGDGLGSGRAGGRLDALLASLLLSVDLPAASLPTFESYDYVHVRSRIRYEADAAAGHHTAADREAWVELIFNGVCGARGRARAGRGGRREGRARMDGRASSRATSEIVLGNFRTRLPSSLNCIAPASSSSPVLRGARACLACVCVRAYARACCAVLVRARATERPCSGRHPVRGRRVQHQRHLQLAGRFEVGVDLFAPARRCARLGNPSWVVRPRRECACERVRRDCVSEVSVSVVSA
jgi:hypothetical protein